MRIFFSTGKIVTLLVEQFRNDSVSSQFIMTFICVCVLERIAGLHTV